jgi:protein-S-isoprenylcysteine O-methyltransferase Ste14
VWLTSNALLWFSLELPQFRSPTLQVAVAVSMLLCIGIYVWASLALGWRASNLTNRGIVTTGPYRWLRHPAYAAKNISWWIGAAPLLIRYACSDRWCLVPVIVGTAAWSGIYVLRAITEERHLGSDPDYRAYRARVRWRFFPGLV